MCEISLQHLCLSGDLLRLRGEERERRRGDRDLRLRGERLTLRREGALGLMSRDRSLAGPTSARERFLLKHTKGLTDILSSVLYCLLILTDHNF